MSSSKYSNELLSEGVIDQETFDRINHYFESTRVKSPNLLLVIFGALGAFLVGMGIILIIAHNWDDLPKSVKTIFAFLPLIMGQALCFYTLKNKPKSPTWRESSSIFLGLSVPASIALVSQVYQLQGDLRSFLFICLILLVPLIYLMRTSVVSLLYWFGTIVFASASYGAAFQVNGLFKYGFLIMMVLPFVYHLFKNKSTFNATILHSWTIPISILVGFGLSISSEGETAPVFFMALLGLLYMLGYTGILKRDEVLKNGFVVIGSLGTVGALLVFSFYEFWESIEEHDLTFTSESTLPILASIILLFLSSILLIYHYKNDSLDKTTPIMPVFLVFLIIYVVGKQHAFSATVLCNLLLLAIGVFTITAGVKRDHLGILNYGLLIVTSLLFCRFFDINISFVIRGIFFIIVGIAFFISNQKLIKSRKVQ